MGKSFRDIHLYFNSRRAQLALPSTLAGKAGRELIADLYVAIREYGRIPLL